MKILSCLLSVCVIAPALWAQGPLAPPAGPPAPGMKTLDQIEPRIPVGAITTPGNATAVHVISSPGSYYLTGNVQGVAGQDGVLIESSNVTLDLGGYTLAGVPTSANGIGLSRSGAALGRITVRNGMIVNFGGRGIYTVASGAIQGLVVEDLTIECTGEAIRSDVNGSTLVRRVFVRGGSGGIFCNTSSFARVEDCTVTNVTGAAFAAGVVEACQVSQVTLTGIGVMVSGGRVARTRVSDVVGSSAIVGIVADEVTDSAVANLTSSNSSQVDGIQADVVNGTRVSNLTSGGGQVRGIALKSEGLGLVHGCTVSSLRSVGTGVVRGIESGTVEDCHVTKIGYEGSTGAVTGILATSRVSDCGVQGIGHAGVTGSVTGISAGMSLGFPSQGNVSGVDLRDLRGGGEITGINAGRTDQSSIGFITQSTGSAHVYAVRSSVVDNCNIYNISAASGQEEFAIAGVAVTSTRVESVGNFGASSMGGISASVVENCSVKISDGKGIRVNGSGSKVTNCLVLSGTLGIDYSGSDGILEDNTVSGCSSGISTSAGSKVLARGNHVVDCFTRYSFGANTRSGPIVSAAGAIASTNPFANFSD